MTEPFLGEVQIFGFNFAPYQWIMCNGATLAISQNAALFSLIGTYYGGNGTSTFQVPNLTNRSPCSQGQGPGLTDRIIGEAFGEESVTLLQSQIPQHTHQAQVFAQSTAQKSPTPGTNASLTSGVGYELYQTNPTANTTLIPTTITMAGGNTPHDNHQPYLAVTFAIAQYGNFPSFN